MEIRSVTLFCEPGLDTAVANQFFSHARQSFVYPVQSCRLATTPFPEWWGEGTDKRKAKRLAEKWTAAGANYISLGPVRLRHETAWLEMIPTIIGASDVLFVAAEIADEAGQIDVGRCWKMADVIQRVSIIQANGFGNLYLTALANCPPGSPFFPVRLSRGWISGFCHCGRSS